MALLSTWVRTESGLACTHLRYYYVTRLLERGFRRKLLHGGICSVAAAGLLNTVRLANGSGNTLQVGSGASSGLQREMAPACQAFRGRMLIFRSGSDLAAKESRQAVADNPP